jgi:PAT family beta-lactamase induction signal transducer AmpG
MPKKFLNSLRYIVDYKVLEIFGLGFIAAVPMAFLSLNLIAWLKDLEVAISIITLFTLARLPTSLRFLWSPFIDNYSFCFFLKFGRRKTWFTICSILIAFLLFITSTIFPPDSLKLLFILCILISVISSIYDINFDAYRIEILKSESQSIGAAAATLGYRAGTILTNAFGLSIVSITGSWQTTIKIIALLFWISAFIIAILVPNNNEQAEFQKSIKSSFRQIVYSPFQDFFKKKDAILIIIAIILYKAGESMSITVIIPYYLDLGFSKDQISETVRIYGFSCSALGICLGLIIMYILGPIKGLIVSGTLHLSIVIALLWLKGHGMEISALQRVVAIENICEGLASVALASYLSAICSKNYLGTQYAILISASGVFGNTICSYSGKLVEILDWKGFFIFCIVISLPSLIAFLFILIKKHKVSLR